MGNTHGDGLTVSRRILLLVSSVIVTSLAGFTVSEVLAAKDWQRRIIVLEERAKTADERYDTLLTLMQQTREAIARLEEQVRISRRRGVRDTLE